MTLSVTNPAPIHITSSEMNVGIINRSASSKQNSTLDAIDKVLSAEGRNLDKLGSNNAVLGLKTELEKNNQIKNVKVIDSSKFLSNGLSLFPEAITWDKAEQLCRQNKIETIFELSFFDTDAKVDYKTSTTQLTNAFGLKIPMIEHQATINTLIKTGWRIYYPKEKIIIDEHTTTDNVVLSGKGINPMSALEAILGRKEAVLNISTRIGENYALQLLPYNIRVSRDYYVKGTNNFEIAKRRAQTGNWDGAAELWEKEVSNPDGKIAGRACYNMAIINEINGNLDKAVEWASKSYADYGDKLALHYVNLLKNRISKNKQLESQKN
ncbi:MAG: DUF6340 family protein [Flavobacterium sp.]